MISIMRTARHPHTGSPLPYSDQMEMIYDALERAANNDIDAQCQRLREYIRTATQGRQKIGTNTAREILAAIGQLMARMPQ